MSMLCQFHRIVCGLALALPTVPSVDAATFTVVNTNDAKTVRAGRSTANATAGTDTVAFNLPGSGVRSIVPATALPQLSQSTVLDATTQPGYSGAPLVEINGATASAGRWRRWIEPLAGGSSTVRAC